MRQESLVCAIEVGHMAYRKVFLSGSVTFGNSFFHSFTIHVEHACLLDLVSAEEPTKNIFFGALPTWHGTVCTTPWEGAVFYFFVSHPHARSFWNSENFTFFRTGGMSFSAHEKKSVTRFLKKKTSKPQPINSKD